MRHYDHISIAPWAPWNPLGPGFGRIGLAANIFDPESFEAHVAETDPIRPDGVGVWLQSPFGRWNPPIPALGLPLVRTTFNLLAERYCRASDLWSWLPAATWLSSDSRRPAAIYVGGNPPSPFPSAMLDDWARRGIAIGIDALAAQTKGSVLTATVMHAVRETGALVYAEANDRNEFLPGIPTIAREWLWPEFGYSGRRPRYSLDDTPTGSLVWYPRGITTEAEVENAKTATTKGLGLVVNLRRTTEYRERVLDIMRATVGG